VPGRRSGRAAAMADPGSRLGGRQRPPCSRLLGVCEAGGACHVRRRWVDWGGGGLRFARQLANWAPPPLPSSPAESMFLTPLALQCGGRWIDALPFLRGPSLPGCVAACLVVSQFAQRRWRRRTSDPGARSWNAFQLGGCLPAWEMPSNKLGARDAQTSQCVRTRDRPAGAPPGGQAGRSAGAEHSPTPGPQPRPNGKTRGRRACEVRGGEAPGQQQQLLVSFGSRKEKTRMSRPACDLGACRPQRGLLLPHQMMMMMLMGG
jgi:hypothetical protein